MLGYPYNTCLVLIVSTMGLHKMFVIALVIRLWKKFGDLVHISMSEIISEISTVVVLIGIS
jgi:hypothetical protein